MTLTRGGGAEPYDSVRPIAGHVSFLGDGVEVVAATGSNVPIE